MYSDDAYTAAFSELLARVEESTLDRDDFTLGLVEEGRRKGIFEAWLDALPDDEKSEVITDCIEDWQGMKRDIVGLVADRFHDHLSAELERRLIVRHAFEAENYKAKQADMQNDIRRVS